MPKFFRTLSTVALSSATTALLLVACTISTPPRTTPTEPAGPTMAPAAATRPSAPSPAAPVQQTAARPQIAGATVRAQPAPGSGGTSPAASVYQQNGASVVNITSLAVVRTRQGQTQTPQGVGSGFVIDTQGRIVTNNHVIAQADQLNVTFQDRTTVPAQLLGRDAPNDLAVLVVDPNAQDASGRPISDRLKPVQMGNSDAITVGEYVVAIGSALGLQQTVTMGIVSALRTPGEDSAQGSLDLLGGAVQTDAAINPGNSGGPLFNAAGEVIGVNTAILSQSGGNEGIGLSIPINVVKRIVPDLIQNGRYAHPLIGVTTLSLQGLGAQLRQQLNIPQNLRGLLVQDVSAGAQQAGIQAGTQTLNAGGEQIRVGGDVITAVDGRAVAGAGELRGYVENNKRPGDTVTLTVWRNGQTRDIQVTLTERPPQETTTTTP